MTKKDVHEDVADARLRLIPALQNICRAFADGDPMRYGMRIPADITRDGDIICNDAAKVLGRLCQFIECLPPSPSEPTGELSEDIDGRDCEIAFNAIQHY